VDLYSKALEIDTNNAVYYSNRAFAHIKLEEYGSAVADATQAVQADPSYVKVEYAQYHIQNTSHVYCNNSCCMYAENSCGCCTATVMTVNYFMDTCRGTTGEVMPTSCWGSLKRR